MSNNIQQQEEINDLHTHAKAEWMFNGSTLNIIKSFRLSMEGKRGKT